MKKLLAASLVLAAYAGAGTRLKEVAAIEGVRDNQLIGYGLVVGLNGTGDKRQTVFSAQALTNILKRMGVTVDPAAILVRNMAGDLFKPRSGAGVSGKNQTGCQKFLHPKTSEWEQSQQQPVQEERTLDRIAHHSLSVHANLEIGHLV